uniref:Uncharacterized protein n=1 Tax=Nothobranchius furzeri TaxID=105023 RepID=A0A1A8UZS5_NOTFU
MKPLVFCLLLLPFAVLVETSPLKAGSPNVLNFLEEALAATTDKTIPETVTEGRNASGRPVKQQDSEDLSDQKSTESLETTKSPQSTESDQSGGESTDPDSHEILAHKDVANEHTRSRPMSRRSQNNVQPGRGTHQGLVPDQSREAPDWDSLEENPGRMPPGHSSRPRDYDESRESTSSEAFPFNPSGVLDPAKNRAA